MKQEQCNMEVDTATLASYGITFYGEEQREDNPQYVLLNPQNPMPQIECKLGDLGVGILSLNTDYSAPEQSCLRAVSPALSDILHEFSVPDGIVPLETSFNSASKQQQHESNLPQYEPCDGCQTEDLDSEPPEDAFAITVSDNESNSSQPSPPKAKVRGRKRLPKAKVVPSQWHCKECVRNFMSPSGLTQHMNTRHPARMKPHQCVKCSKRYSRPDELEAHMARHSAKNKPFLCTFDGCSKRFVHRHDRDRHFATVHGEAPFTCELCGKGFGRKDQLEKHYVSHKHNTNYYKHLIS